MKITNFDNIQARTLTADDAITTLTAEDTNIVIDAPATVDFVLTLPDPKDISRLRKSVFFFFRNSAKTVTITAPTGLKSKTGVANRDVKINGAATKTIAADLGYVKLMALDSENYVIIG